MANYNDGSLKVRGQSYPCGCIVGVYDCYESLMLCGANPHNQDKIKGHRRELLWGPRSAELDIDMYAAKEGLDYWEQEDCCSCHINPPCNYCLSRCPDCEEHVDECDCGGCNV